VKLLILFDTSADDLIKAWEDTVDNGGGESMIIGVMKD
jgi:hypothetical protein